MDNKELRRLLEMAAKAAGISGHFGLGGETDNFWLEGEHGESTGVQWAPHIDDGDSRRLEVKLKMRVVIWPAGVEAIGETGASALVRNDEAGCQFAATRLAVLRVAAAIGEAMP